MPIPPNASTNQNFQTNFRSADDQKLNLLETHKSAMASLKKTLTDLGLGTWAEKMPEVKQHFWAGVDSDTATNIATFVQHLSTDKSLTSSQLMSLTDPLQSYHTALDAKVFEETKGNEYRHQESRSVLTALKENIHSLNERIKKCVPEATSSKEAPKHGALQGLGGNAPAKEDSLTNHLAPWNFQMPVSDQQKILDEQLKNIKLALPSLGGNAPVEEDPLTNHLAPWNLQMPVSDQQKILDEQLKRTGLKQE
jgi:hypothetical protein